MTNIDGQSPGSELTNIPATENQADTTNASWPTGEELQALIKRPVALHEVRRFASLPYFSRVEYLSLVRALDHESRQKSLPVLTSLLAFILGGSATALLDQGAWSLVPLCIGGAGAVFANRVGKADAKKESTHASWVKALEDVHAELTKKSGIDN